MCACVISNYTLPGEKSTVLTNHHSLCRDAPSSPACPPPPHPIHLFASPPNIKAHPHGDVSTSGLSTPCPEGHSDPCYFSADTPDSHSCSGFVMGEGIEGVALQMDRNTNPMFPSGSQHSASLHFHPFSGHGKMITPPCSKKQATTAAGNHRCDARAYAPSSQSGKKDLVRPELSKRLQICPCARM